MCCRRFVLRCAGLACAVVFALGALFALPVQAAQIAAGEGAAGAAAPPEVGAEAYVVMDAATGQIVIEKNSGQLLHPASITKIFTAGLVLELMEQNGVGMEQAVEVTPEALQGLSAVSSRVGLLVGEVVTMGDLLYATQIRSANDAANALAVYWGGSIAGFADLMNAKAAELGLAASRFANPSGLPDDTHLVTAADMALVTRWALGVSGFRELFGTTNYEMAPTRQHTARSLASDNQLFADAGRYWLPDITGSKTGHTSAAAYTMVTAAARGDAELICVVLRCPANVVKYEATLALLNYCFDNFGRFYYAEDLLEAQAVPVYGDAGPLGEIHVGSAGRLSFLLHRGVAAEHVRVEYAVPEQYVLGEAIAPEARLYLDLETAAQCRELLRVPLAVNGLDDFLPGGAPVAAGAPEEGAGGALLALAGGLALGLTGLALAVGQAARRNKLAKQLAARETDPLPDVGCWLPKNQTAESAQRRTVHRRDTRPRNTAGIAARYGRR